MVPPLIRELSIVMPAFNEEAVLPLALDEAVAALEGLCARWELIVVDDGSTDGTPRLLTERAARNGHLVVLTQSPNQGYSRALQRGFAAARYEAIFYTDADAQFDLAEIARLYPHLAAVDMVAGYRLRRQDPPVRRLTSVAYNRIQALVLGLRVRDVNCAFKLFRRSFFAAVELTSGGFLIDAEIYARARRAGLTWRQVGVTHRPRRRGASTVATVTAWQTLRELWRLKRSLA